MRKHVLRTLGVSLLAGLGLMAFAARGAQAEKSGEIWVLGSAHLATGVSLTGESLGVGLKILKVPASNLETVCKELEVVEGQITSGLTGHGLVLILYVGCAVWSIELGTLKLISELKTCQILGPEGGKAGHITVKANLLTLLHKGSTYIVAEPDNPELTGPIATFEFTKGIGCPLGLKQSISGNVVFKVVAGDLALGSPEVEKITIETSEAIAALFPNSPRMFGNTVFITGQADLSLTGGHIGCTWGVI